MPKYPFVNKDFIGTYFIFPAYPTLLSVKLKNGKTKNIHFTNRARIFCYRNKTIGIKSKDILYEVYNVDKLLRIEYKRNEKEWKKYNGRIFKHYFNGNKKWFISFSGREEVVSFEEIPNLIQIVSDDALWGLEYISDEEVE